jgi:hypothetical protein
MVFLFGFLKLGLEVGAVMKEYGEEYIPYDDVGFGLQPSLRSGHLHQLPICRLLTGV